MNFSVSIVESSNKVAQECVAEDVDLRIGVGDSDSAPFIFNEIQGDRIRLSWQSVLVLADLNSQVFQRRVKLSARHLSRIAIGVRRAVKLVDFRSYVADKVLVVGLAHYDKRRACVQDSIIDARILDILAVILNVS